MLSLMLFLDCSSDHWKYEKLLLCTTARPMVVKTAVICVHVCTHMYRENSCTTVRYLCGVKLYRCSVPTFNFFCNWKNLCVAFLFLFIYSTTIYIDIFFVLHIFLYATFSPNYIQQKDTKGNDIDDD